MTLNLYHAGTLRYLFTAVRDALAKFSGIDCGQGSFENLVYQLEHSLYEVWIWRSRFHDTILTIDSKETILRRCLELGRPAPGFKQFFPLLHEVGLCGKWLTQPFFSFKMGHLRNLNKLTKWRHLTLASRSVMFISEAWWRILVHDKTVCFGTILAAWFFDGRFKRREGLKRACCGGGVC